MNYTENYHLPQWVKEDRIMMDDFNQMCADMEAGLVKNASSAAAAASAASSGTAAAKKAQTAANNAQASADAAQETADTALDVANAAFALNNRPYVLGRFITSPSAITMVDVGFQPYFLIVWYTANTSQGYPAVKVYLTDGVSGGEWLTRTATGFRIAQTGNTPETYFYLAFR